MNDKKTTELEKYIEKYKYEKMFDGEHINSQKFPECIVLKKHQVGDIFYDYHHHDIYEILYIVSGKLLYGIENKKYVLEAGDLVLISPSILHKLLEVIENPCERIIITFPERYIKKFCTERTDLLKVSKLMNTSHFYKVSFNNIYKKRFEEILQILINTLFVDDYGTDVIFDSAFVQMMVLINKEYIQTKPMYQDYTSENKIVTLASQYIMMHLHEKIIIDDIAKYVNLSASRLQHIFKIETGISMVKYINKKRLIHSKELLRNGQNVIEIYQRCGFQDYTSFFRAFKKEYDLTPKTYQQQYKEFIKTQMSKKRENKE